MAWAGWLLVAAVLILRGRHRWRSVAFFAVVVACAIYAGEPEALVFLAIAVALLVVMVLGGRILGRPESGPVVRPLLDLVVAGVAGAALGAPLLLPGTQIGGVSLRNLPRRPGHAGRAQHRGGRSRCTTSSTSCSRGSTGSPYRARRGSPIATSTSTPSPTSA